MSKKFEEGLIDNRLVKRNIKKGLVDPKEYKDYLKALPDESKNADYIKVFEEESEAPAKESGLTFSSVENA